MSDSDLEELARLRHRVAELEAYVLLREREHLLLVEALEWYARRPSWFGGTNIARETLDRWRKTK